MNKGVQRAILLFIVFLLLGCEVKKEALITGKTMGTTYQIKVVTGRFKNLGGLKEKIDKRLEKINRSMSTYIKDSEISRFNAFRGIDEKFYISNDFINVITVGKNLYELTDGAWDGTIMPVVNLWGFGGSKIKKRVYEKEEIDKFIPDIGFNQIAIIENRYIVKKKASIALDFGSIAKGYAVDIISELLDRKGINNYIVEIGGEVFASGLRKDGKYWKIGINRPQKDASYDNVHKAVFLYNKALATSGDYRNFFVKDGTRYSHVMNPKTGYPVSNGVVSVSILADTCTFADGLATAVMVLGHESGLELVNRLNNVECLIIVQEKDGALVDYYSKGFQLSWTTLN